MLWAQIILLLVVLFLYGYLFEPNKEGDVRATIFAIVVTLGLLYFAGAFTQIVPSCW